MTWWSRINHWVSTLNPTPNEQLFISLIISRYLIAKSKRWLHFLSSYTCFISHRHPLLARSSYNYRPFQNIVKRTRLLCALVLTTPVRTRAKLVKREECLCYGVLVHVNCYLHYSYSSSNYIALSCMGRAGCHKLDISHFAISFWRLSYIGK